MWSWKNVITHSDSRFLARGPSHSTIEFPPGRFQWDQIFIGHIVLRAALHTCCLAHLAWCINGCVFGMEMYRKGWSARQILGALLVPWLLHPPNSSKEFRTLVLLARWWLHHIHEPRLSGGSKVQLISFGQPTSSQQQASRIPPRLPLP